VGGLDPPCELNGRRGLAAETPMDDVVAVACRLATLEEDFRHALARAVSVIVLGLLGDAHALAVLAVQLLKAEDSNVRRVGGEFARNAKFVDSVLNRRHPTTLDGLGPEDATNLAEVAVRVRAPVRQRLPFRGAWSLHSEASRRFVRTVEREPKGARRLSVNPDQVAAFDRSRRRGEPGDVEALERDHQVVDQPVVLFRPLKRLGRLGHCTCTIGPTVRRTGDRQFADRHVHHRVRVAAARPHLVETLVRREPNLRPSFTLRASSGLEARFDLVRHIHTVDARRHFAAHVRKRGGVGGCPPVPPSGGRRSGGRRSLRECDPGHGQGQHNGSRLHE